MKKSHAQDFCDSVIEQKVGGMTRIPGGLAMNVGEFNKWMDDNPNTIWAQLRKVRHLIPSMYDFSGDDTSLPAKRKENA